MSRPGTTRGAGVGCAAAALALLSACAPQAEAILDPAEDSRLPGGTALLELDFEDLAGGGPIGPGSLPLPGTTGVPLEARLATVGGGRAVPEPGPDGQALRLPRYDAETSVGAVLVIGNASPDDGLSPGTRDFTFGADFVLDAVSDEGGRDNGNNLVQRGLFADAAQYKLQVEKGRASCRVRGSAGEVVVVSDTVVEPRTWYQVACTRLGDVVALELGPLGGESRRVVASGATGDVRLPPGAVLSVGGKATAAGEAVTGNSDQFNGAVDRVFLEVGAAL